MLTTRLSLKELCEGNSCFHFFFFLSAGSGCALLDQRQCSTSFSLNRFSIDGINATYKSQTH